MPEPWESRVVTDGLDRAPHRAFLRAMGHDEAAIARPFAGLVSTGASVTPCSMSLKPQVEAAQLGLQAGGVTPFEFSTITVADSMSMNHAGMRFSGRRYTSIYRRGFASVHSLSVRPTLARGHTSSGWTVRGDSPAIVFQGG